MQSITLLGILKYAGFIVSAASTIWGLLTKTSFEDDHGRKRLTAGGQVAIAIAITSALISILAYGFDSLDQQRRAELEHQREEAKQRKDDLRYLKTERLNQQRTNRQILGQQKLWTNQLRALQLSEDQLLLESKISQTLDRSSTATLGRVEEGLRQLGRLSQPIEPITISGKWELDYEDFANEPWIRRVNDAIDRYAGGKIKRLEGAHILTTGETITHLVITPHSDLYPTTKESSWWVAARAGTGIMLFYQPPNRKTIARTPRANLSENVQTQAGDLFFNTPLHDREIVLDFERNSLVIYFEESIPQDIIKKSGKILSILDLGNATLVVKPYFFVYRFEAGKRFALRQFSMSVGGVPYNYEEKQFGRTVDEEGYPLFRRDHIGLPPSAVR